MKVQIQNGMPYVNGELVGWADIVVTIAGVPITGITGVEYNDEQLSTGTIEVTIKNVPVGVVRKFKVKIGFVKSLE